MSRLNPARRLARGLGCLLTKPKTKVMVPILTQIAAILVVMGNGLWLAHQDRAVLVGSRGLLILQFHWLRN